MNIKYTAAFAAALVTTPAFAQDDATFTGPRIEALAGYDAVDTNTTGIGTIDGAAYGIGAGYDFQWGGTVVGIEGEAMDSSANQRFGAAKVSASRDLYAGVRAGFVTGPALIYAKVGYTNFRVKATAPGGSASANADGVRAGLGVEYALNGPLYAKAEYRYSNYEAGIERHQGIVGLGYRF